MESGKRINGLLLSFLAGGAVGGAVALLYAPKKGKHLRNDISKKTSDLIDQGKKLTYDTWNGAKDAAESTFESANDFLNTGLENIAKKTEKVKEIFRTESGTFKDEPGYGRDKDTMIEESGKNKIKKN